MPEDSCRYCFEAPCRCHELVQGPSLQEVDADYVEQPDEAYFIHIPTGSDEAADPYLTDLLDEPFIQPVDKTAYMN